MAPIAVYIVDDESSVRQALARLVQSAGMRAEVFESVPELIGLGCFADPACVIADIHMPDVSGLELPGLLARHGHRLPVIFVTAYDSEQNREARKTRWRCRLLPQADRRASLAGRDHLGGRSGQERDEPRARPVHSPPEPRKCAMKKRLLLTLIRPAAFARPCHVRRRCCAGDVGGRGN